MRKQIFSLVLGAAILSTHSGFCMDRKLGEGDEPKEGLLCRLRPEIRQPIFDKLERKDFQSIACTSKSENEQIRIKIDLHFIYKNWVHSNPSFFKNVEFSLYMDEEGKTIPLGQFALTSIFPKGWVCTSEWRAKV